MTVYQLDISRTAHKQLLRLPGRIRERMHQVISGLADIPRPSGVKKLTDREGYRIRVGEYRILYRIFDNEKRIVIDRVMPRGDVYKG